MRKMLAEGNCPTCGSNGMIDPTKVHELSELLDELEALRAELIRVKVDPVKRKMRLRSRELRALGIGLLPNAPTFPPDLLKIGSKEFKLQYEKDLEENADELSAVSKVWDGATGDGFKEDPVTELDKLVNAYLHSPDCAVWRKGKCDRSCPKKESLDRS